MITGTLFCDILDQELITELSAVNDSKRMYVDERMLQPCFFDSGECRDTTDETNIENGPFTGSEGCWGKKFIQ